MKKYITLFTTLTALIISCQKEIGLDSETSPIPNPSITDTTLLRKFILLDTTLAAPNDTIYKYSFYYDNLKRCTVLKGNDGIDSFVVFNIFNGNDTLITKRKIYDFSSGDSTIEYLTYSPAGKILYDSIKEYSLSISNFFLDYQNTTNQNGIIAVKSNGTQFEYNKFSTLRDNNGNILNVKDSLSVLSGINYLLKETANSTISYDTRKNPFYKLVPNFLVNVQLESSTIFTFIPFQSLPQKNNILTETKFFNPQTSGLDNVSNTYQYIYNLNNYPVIVRVRDILNNKNYKGIYVY